MSNYMKIGRNDPCPCGSGKKYKKCCLKTDGNSEMERQSQNSSDDGKGEDVLGWEAMAGVYNTFRRFLLKDKPHIKAYKKIRKMHGEIVGSMIEYHQNDKFEQKVDNHYQPDVALKRKHTATLYLHELEFDMQSDRSIQAFYDILVYKISPNINCITEDYINNHRYRKPEKIEFLQSMLDSRLGLFDVVGKDTAEGYVHVKDVLNGNEYTLTDMGLSSDISSNEFLIYTRIITYRGVTFGTGLNMNFSKSDSFIKSFIKRHKADYHSFDEFGEFGRFIELYKHSCRTSSKIKFLANSF